MPQEPTPERQSSRPKTPYSRRKHNSSRTDAAAATAAAAASTAAAATDTAALTASNGSPTVPTDTLSSASTIAPPLVVIDDSSPTPTMVAPPVSSRPIHTATVDYPFIFPQATTFYTTAPAVAPNRSPPDGYPLVGEIGRNSDNPDLPNPRVNLDAVTELIQRTIPIFPDRESRQRLVTLLVEQVRQTSLVISRLEGERIKGKEIPEAVIEGHRRHQNALTAHIDRLTSDWWQQFIETMKAHAQSTQPLVTSLENHIKSMREFLDKVPHTAHSTRF